MTKKQIEQMCEMGHGHRLRNQMLDIVIAKVGINKLLIINKDGSISGIPREALYNTCIAMVNDTCFYIDGEKGLSKLTLPFRSKDRTVITHKDRMAAIAYAKNHGIKMPPNLLRLFYESMELIPYALPAKNLISGEKEKARFAEILRSVIWGHKDIFLQGGWLSAKDLCDEIIYGYNKRILSTMAFCENIETYPKGSLIRRLVTYAFNKVWVDEGPRSNIVWVERNITPSMDEADIGLLKAVTSIKKPVYEKAEGNKTPHTFDVIRLWFNLVSKETMPERNEFIKENKKGFARLALACVQDDRRYKLPINLLKIDHIGITSQSQLEFIFSLKDSVVAVLQG